MRSSTASVLPTSSMVASGTRFFSRSSRTEALAPLSARADTSAHPKDFLSLADWTRDALERIVDRSLELKELRR